jgi:RNA polymerase sigma-70 factor (ECF subfamily)
VELSEQQHVHKLQNGDITVFEMFFRTYYQSLCNYAYTFLQDRDESEEIVQASFLTIWEKREVLEIRTSLKSYLYTAVRNACLNVIKHEKIKQRHVSEALAVSERSHDSVTHRVLSSELEDRIQTSMAKLPEQCRLIFKLSRFEELKYAEIAEQLNISIKTVENQMGKALRIMREELKDYLPMIIVLMNGFLG